MDRKRTSCNTAVLTEGLGLGGHIVLALFHLLGLYFAWKRRRYGMVCFHVVGVAVDSNAVAEHAAALRHSPQCDCEVMR